MKNSDQIHIHDLVIPCYVGITEQERALSQDLFLSLTLTAPLEKAGLSDQLKDTVDYGKIMNDLRLLLQGKTFWLIEKVAESAAQMVLKNFSIKEVLVQVSKRTLPGVKSVTVSITRKN